uniref:CCHC-type domain-containing protein n=1 Tax=Setaria viridis TaxID=4556 RepID=A0A4U6U0Y1_SETVI|nr:hypothetical protein SEVIR_6G069600v2 [Setaria viridis]
MDLKDFSCDGFHVGFFFNNSSGLAQAFSFAKKDSGPAYHWELVRPRKGKAVSLAADQTMLKSDDPWNVGFNKSVNYDKASQALSGYRFYGSSSQAAKGFHDDSSPSLASKDCSSSGFSRSYAETIKLNLNKDSPLSGVNLVPLGDRPLLRNSASLVGTSSTSDRPLPLAPKKVRQSVFQRLVIPGLNRSNVRDNRPVVGRGPSVSRISSFDLAGSRDLRCSRCLSPNHLRSSCVSRIYCRHCKKQGHTRNDCKAYHDLQGFIKRCGDSFGCSFSPCLSAGDWPSNCHLTWFKAGPSPGQRPTSPAQPPVPLPRIATVAPPLTPSSLLGPPTLQQFPPTPENIATCRPPPLPSAPMAFLNIDPQPMMLAGFNRVIIHGRQQFARVVHPRATPRNENLAIVTVTNLPPGEILFGPLRNVILQFLEHDLGLEVLDVQRCPFGRGQAYVRLGRPSDRDALIAQSPHFRNGFAFLFVQHNRAANARRVTFNRECWLMLIGFPLDSCSVREIEDAICSFGRMILWQKDNVLARVIIKARVTELTDIPHYLILSEGDDFEGVSFTVQCEILQQNLLGGFLQDEDIPPGGLDDNFVFPGIQPQGPPNQLDNFQNPALQQDGGIPDLNDNPQDNQNNQNMQEDDLMEDIGDEEDPDDEAMLDILLEEAQAIHQEEEQQVELDLHLHLSPPPQASPSPDLEAPLLPMVVFNEGSPQAIVLDPIAPPPQMGHPLDFHAQQMGAQHGNMVQMGAQEGNQGAQEVVLGLQAPIQEGVGLGQNVAQEGHLFVNLNINMVLTQDQQVNLSHLPRNITGSMSSFLPDCLSTPKDFNIDKQRPGQNPNVYRLWAQHFSPVGCPEQVTQIPSDWAAFFINMLMSPEHFDWAKQFLASKTWEFLLSCSNQTALMAFAIPQRCPSSTPLICSLSQEEEARSPKKARVRLGIRAAPECESSVRRSDRIKAKSKGFRRSPCQDNTCLACSACPPTISADVIQSLGTKVCALDRTKIGPGKLSFNSGSQKPIGRTTTTRLSEADSKGKEALSEASSNSSNGV